MSGLRNVVGLLVVAGCSLVAAEAYAQAPGQTAPTAPGSSSPSEPSSYPTYPSGQPYSSTPETVVQPEVDPMKNRFTIGLGLGSAQVSDEYDAEASFRLGLVSIGYRLARQLDIELAFYGGRQNLDGEDGPLAMGGGYLGARYRIAPYRKFNGYVGLALGQVMIDQHETTEEMLDGAKRTLIRITGGVEYRWQRFSVGGELGMSALGARSDSDYGYSDGWFQAQELSSIDICVRSAVHF